MKRIFLSILAMIALVGCSAAGHKQMGDWIKMPDGSLLSAFQAKNSGVSGPDVTAIETWRCPEKKNCERVGTYSGSAPGAIEVGVAGMGQAGLNAVGAGVAARFLSQTKPTQIHESTNVTGVAGDVSPTAKAEAKAEGGKAEIKDSGNSKVNTKNNLINQPGPVTTSSTSASNPMTTVSPTFKNEVEGSKATIEKGAIANNSQGGTGGSVGNVSGGSVGSVNNSSSSSSKTGEVEFKPVTTISPKVEVETNVKPVINNDPKFENKPTTTINPTISPKIEVENKPVVSTTVSPKVEIENKPTVTATISPKIEGSSTEIKPVISPVVNQNPVVNVMVPQSKPPEKDGGGHSGNGWD